MAEREQGFTISIYKASRDRVVRFLTIITYTRRARGQVSALGFADDYILAV